MDCGPRLVDGRGAEGEQPVRVEEPEEAGGPRVRGEEVLRRPRLGHALVVEAARPWGGRAI